MSKQDIQAGAAHVPLEVREKDQPRPSREAAIGAAVDALDASMQLLRQAGDTLERAGLYSEWSNIARVHDRVHQMSCRLRLYDTRNAPPRPSAN